MVRSSQQLSFCSYAAAVAEAGIASGGASTSSSGLLVLAPPSTNLWTTTLGGISQQSRHGPVTSPAVQCLGQRVDAVSHYRTSVGLVGTGCTHRAFPEIWADCRGVRPAGALALFLGDQECGQVGELARGA
jgi:hypothetical protein